MYRTAPVAVGLGQTRPAWCPTTSLKPGTRDPCEVVYAFDLPLVGKTSFGLPIPAMTNDALLTIRKQLPLLLPALLDEAMPVVYDKLQPYIEDLTDFVVPRAVEAVLRNQVTPLIEVQKEEILVHSDVLLKKALVGLGAVVALGLGGYWFIRRRTR